MSSYAVMGHRHLFGASQTFEGNHAQSWNNMNMEQPNMQLARGSSVENGTYFYPVENVAVNGAHYASHWTAPRSSEYVPLGHNDVLPHCQPNVAGLSQDSFVHAPNMGTFRASTENYACHGSSSSSSLSNYNGHVPYGVDGGFIDLTADGGRGHLKRKSPVIPSLCERGSSSRYYCPGSGSSSAPPVSSELQLDEPDIDSLHAPWDHLSANGDYTYNGPNSLSIRGEGPLRNVRSRYGVELDTNVSRAHMPTNPHNFIYTSNPVEHSRVVDLQGQSNGLTCDWSHTTVPPAHGRMSMPGGYRDGPNQSFGGSSTVGSPIETGGSDFISRRNSILRQGHLGSSSQPLRSVRSISSQRSSRDPRPSSSGLRSLQVGPSEERLPSVADGYSRHPRPLSAIGWRNNDGARRSRVSTERFRSFPDEGSGHDQLEYEGFMIADRSGFYASRSVFDEHRDLRLDIDNMGYEELLALGERIGNVSTGLSEDSIAKCLKETVQYSSEKFQDQSRCVICLEEYQNMDYMGALKTCGHDYHAGCIRKWLSMKNLCPICKAPALDEGMKQA
ncbi:E3 ubiquitin-protein ligase MBR2 isoform X1 [Syzygium oleosum]|uniref:E3 ubiquitin-protein ligase MBR2 isoform X1 n=2 Tax=Syzygium oleosum TaxID=219896 RepID=UPI0024B91A56|nr:E3 ubiquitin-protein ligase MBR2 isoform X1 [Syzygium oleosum]